MRYTLGMVATAVVLLVGSAALPGGTDGDLGDPTASAGGHGGQRAERDCSSAFYWEQPDCPLPALVALDDIQAITGVDAIPPIDEPRFESVAASGEWLSPESPLLVVTVGGDSRGYPVAILTWHEVVNDEIAGEPVLVTYCPLCNSGLVFGRTVAGEVLTFGTSGHLFRSNLVMYDRQHRNFWLQFTGRAVAGERWAGTELERIPSQLLGFGEFAALAPGAAVLSRDTGFDRPYGTNPYRGYDDREGRPFLYDGPVDDRLPQMERVVGVGTDQPIAVTLDLLRTEKVVEVNADGGPVVLLWAPGQVSALEADEVDGGREVGQTAAFRPVGPSGERLTLRPAGPGVFFDTETRSHWNLHGEALAGPLVGHRLERAVHDDTFWFTWFAFHTDTRLRHVPIDAWVAGPDVKRPRTRWFAR